VAVELLNRSGNLVSRMPAGAAPIPTTGDYLNQYMAHQPVSQPTSDAAALIGQYCGSSIAQSERFPDPEPLSCRPLDPQCRSWP
jgi:hypothetical protein